jgi:hypothetical protein
MKKNNIVFRKPIEEIELLTAEAAAERFMAADKSFIISETLKYNLPEFYKKNHKSWSGYEGFAEQDGYLIMSLFNQTKKGELVKRGFHDEFKILKTDESIYRSFKKNKYEDPEFNVTMKGIQDMIKKYKEEKKQKLQEIENQNPKIIFTFFNK